MDDELQELAIAATLNAYFRGFARFARRYVDAASGLGKTADDLCERLAENTSLWYALDEAPNTAFLDILSFDKGGAFLAHHATLRAALENSDAAEVYLQRQRVFERRDGEWYFLEP